MISAVMSALLVALRCPHSPSGRTGWRAHWCRLRRLPPGGGRWLMGGGVMALCLVVWYRAGGPDALGEWISRIAHAALVLAPAIR